MWCVIQVLTGKEDRVRKACLKYIDDGIIEETFIPMYVRRRKYAGVWKDELRALFPGYVFIITDRPMELYAQLRRVVGMTRLLRNGAQILRLTADEEDFMKRLGGDRHVTEMSTGFIKGDKVTVTQGPLMGLEGQIRKIDRHKRQCLIEVNMFGQKVRTAVGLEIVSKS